MGDGVHETAISPSGRGMDIHVDGPADAVVASMPPESPDSVILWDRPVAPAAALEALSGSPGDIPLGASFRLEGGAAVAMDRIRAAGIRLICWAPVPGAFPPAVREDLLAASRHGIWNHIRFEDPLDPVLANLAVSSPDIVHSWQAGGKADEFAMPPPGHPLTTGYGDVAPLAGIPLWRHLGAPGRLLAYLHRYGKDRVRLWRVDPDTGAGWEIGTDLSWHFQPPAALPAGALDEICRMVAAGGSVNIRWVRHNLERAFLIAFVSERGQIVGNSSLKHPREEYLETVRTRYGLDFSRHLERGYTSVRPEYRAMGIGTRLLEGLTSRAGDRRIFSIIAEDNVATQKIAIRNRTRKVATVFSEAMGKQIGFWVPEDQDIDSLK